MAAANPVLDDFVHATLSGVMAGTELSGPVRSQGREPAR